MIKFITVDQNSEKHIRFLFNLLSYRNFPISHKSTPNFEDHKTFVQNHPYRYWLIACLNDTYIGSTYICSDNVVGINLIKENNEDFIEIIKYVKKNYKPLKPIKSVRNKNFLININPKNEEFKKALIKMDIKHIQNTYLIE